MRIHKVFSLLLTSLALAAISTQAQDEVAYDLAGVYGDTSGPSAFTGNLGRGNTSVSVIRSGTKVAYGDLAVHVTGTAGGMSPVPEPSTWSLMAVGLISCGGLAYVRRKRSGVA